MTNKVAAKNGWTLTRVKDFIDVTAFGDTNKTYLVYDRNGISISRPKHVPVTMGRGQAACLGCGCCPAMPKFYHCRQCLGDLRP